MGSKENIIVQRNDFIRGDFSSLNIRDMKILKLLISKVNSTQESFSEYYYVSKDEIRAFYFNEKNLHSYIKTSLRKLASLFVLVKDDNNQEIEVSLIGKIIYDKKNGIYRVPLNGDLKKYILDVKREFTKYNLKNLVYLNTKAELKLYEYIKSISFQVFTINIEKLRVIMELNQKSYESFYNFHNKLKGAISNINEYTDIHLSYTILKTNGVSSTIRFHVKHFDAQYLSIKNELHRLNGNYQNKFVSTDKGVLQIKDIYDDGHICIKAFSDKLNMLGTLKFESTEKCNDWLSSNVVT